MRQKNNRIWIFTGLLAFLLHIGVPVGAASSSEIRSQINALQAEKKEIQQKIAQVQEQY